MSAAVDPDNIYKQLWTIVDGRRTGRVSGTEVFSLFQSSGLPKDKLAQVWQVSSGGGVFLTPPQFVLACKLVSLAQHTRLPITVQSVQQAGRLPPAKMRYPQMGPPRGAPMGRGMPTQMAPGGPMGRGRGMPMNRGMPVGAGMPNRMNPNPAMPGMMPGGPMMRPGQQMPGQSILGQPSAPSQAQPNPTAPQAEGDQPKADPFASLLVGSSIGNQLAAAKKKTPEASPAPQDISIFGGPTPSQPSMGMMAPHQTSAIAPSQPGSSAVDKYSETSKLRNLLRGAEEAERKAKQENFKLREQVESMERQMKEMKTQFEVWQQQSQQIISERQENQRTQQENQLLKNNCEQWQKQHMEQAQVIENLNHELTELRDQLAMSKDFQSERESFQAKVNAAEQRAMAAEEQLSGREREIFSLNREKNALIDDLDHFRKTVAPGVQPDVSQQKPVQVETSENFGFSDIAASARPVNSPAGPDLGAPATVTIYDEYKKGDLVMRKGQVCKIIKIDSSMEPPDVTVRVNSSGQLIGTEFTKLEKYIPGKEIAQAQPSNDFAQAQLSNDFAQAHFSNDFAPAPIQMQPAPPSTEQRPIAPQPVPQNQPNPTQQKAEIEPLTANAMKTYEKFFVQADTNKDGLVDGGEAFSFFSKSGLDRQTLATVWRVVDVGSKGMLSKVQFFSMFHIVLLARKTQNFQIPTMLPPVLSETHLLKLLEPAVSTGGWDAF